MGEAVCPTGVAVGVLPTGVGDGVWPTGVGDGVGVGVAQPVAVFAMRATLVENSEVLPSGSVAVVVTTVPAALLSPQRETLKLPLSSAVRPAGKSFHHHAGLRQRLLQTARPGSPHTSCQ